MLNRFAHGSKKVNSKYEKLGAGCMHPGPFWM